jgi:hypothetical protein
MKSYLDLFLIGIKFTAYTILAISIFILLHIIAILFVPVGF